MPLATEKNFNQNPKLGEIFADNFALHPSTAATYNGWLQTTAPVDSVADALKFGMRQLLTWRTLRAEVDTGRYVTNQPFFQQAHEDALTPHRAATAVEKAQSTDPQYRQLSIWLAHAQEKKSQATSGKPYPENVPDVAAADDEQASIQAAIRTRTEALCGEVAYPDAKPSRCARPGETAWDIGTNDQSDLLQGAEEMRLLLAYLHPEQREERWQVRRTILPSPSRNAYPSTLPPVLSVRHDQPHADSPEMTLGVSGFLFKVVWSTVASRYDVADDVLAAPHSGLVPFLKRYTTPEEVTQLTRSGKSAIDLFDNYVHDSRCWFRVPYFHEYAPGGYGWPRVFFAGGDKRIRYLGMTTDAQLDVS